MSVYRLLGDYLSRQQGDHVNLTFAGIEQILWRRLPPSARDRAEWWANNYSSPTRHCWPGWLSAGWKVDGYNLGRETVAFTRDRGGLSKKAITSISSHETKVPTTRSSLVQNGKSAGLTATREWYWEGNVQAALASWLKTQGWTIHKTADTASHEHGIDIVAKRDAKTLAIEVKGYPPAVYTFGVRKGEAKPAPQARLQASHFFAQALHAAIRTRTRFREAEIALAFPDIKCYLDLVREAAWALRRLDISAYVVTEEGKVRQVLALVQQGDRLEMEAK